MFGSDSIFSLTSNCLEILRKQKEVRIMYAQRHFSPLFFVGISLILVLMGLSGCRPALIEEGAVSEAATTSTPVAQETAPAVEETAAGPVETTQAFYDWYFDYIGEPGSDNFRNPLVDGVYRDSEYLTPRLIEAVDTALATWREEGVGGGDPFLMAQDFPQGTTVEALDETGDTARVIVHQQWGERIRDLTVSLVRLDGTWKIDKIQEGSPRTPEGVTQLFYQWYLEYIGDRSDGNFNNPLVDGAYRSSEYLSAAFIEKVDGILASAEGGGYDPILQAQDIPRGIYVSMPEVEGDSATVTVERLWEGNPTVSPMTVQLERQDGQWLIVDVTSEVASSSSSDEVAGSGGAKSPAIEAALASLSAAVAAPEGQIVTNETAGFSFRIPAGWVAQEMQMDAPGMPEDWPVEAGYLLMPTALAEEMAAQNGPPSPDDPLLIPPFTVEVLVGDQAAFDRVYVPAEASVETSINGHAMTVAQEGSDYTLMRYIFRHPEDSSRWIIFQDVVSHFPGREVQAAEIAGVLPQILSSLTFSE